MRTLLSTRALAENCVSAEERVLIWLGFTNQHIINQVANAVADLELSLRVELIIRIAMKNPTLTYES